MSYKFVWSLLFFLVSGNSFPQDTLDNNISDFTYDEIKAVWLETTDRYTKEFFQLHIKKAKKEKDTIQWAHAYRFKAWDEKDFGKALKTLDSAIVLANMTRNKDILEYVEFMALAYDTKSKILYESFQDELAVEAIINCIKWAKKANHRELMIIGYTNLATLKAEFGQENEGVLLAKKTLAYAKKQQANISAYDFYHFQIHYYIARCYTYARKTDSARIHVGKAFEISKESGDTTGFRDFKVLNAQLDYYDGYFLRAKDSLIKYNNNKRPISLADRHFYMGMIEGKLGNPELKKKYFHSFDSILGTLNYPFFDNTNEVYKFLLKDAIENDEKSKEREYYNRLAYYDSLYIHRQERFREITLKQFDIPSLEEELSSLNTTISTKNRLILIFYFICAILFLSGFGYYIKYRNTRKKLNLALNHPVEVESKNTMKSPKSEKQVDESLLLEILEELNMWESQNGFLDSTTSLQSLAKQLETNTTYLSHAINTFKGQNFSSYLKDLRITYAINHLKANPKIVRTHSMIQLAEMYGFSSLTVFGKALKAKIGVTPGAFLRQLSKKNRLS